MKRLRFFILKFLFTDSEKYLINLFTDSEKYLIKRAIDERVESIFAKSIESKEDYFNRNQDIKEYKRLGKIFSTPEWK